MESKGKRKPEPQTAQVHAITRASSEATQPEKPVYQSNETKKAGDKFVTGLPKRDKERTRKILDKYRARPNMEQTKKNVF